MKIRLTERDDSRAVLAAIAEKVTSRKPLNSALGKRAEIELRGHFERRNAEGNSRGWPSQQFWARIRTATALASADETAARVVIADPAINQKIFGGTITPKESKYLALPAIAEAYGKSPRVFDFLQPLYSRRQGRVIALIEKEQQGKGWGGRVWYWLVKSVTQRADERALPPEEALRAALLDEAKRYLDRL